jgi:hypothetical protein
MARGANTPSSAGRGATRQSARAPQTRQSHRRTPEALATRALARFDDLRELAADPQLPQAVAERISEQAWTIVEESEPVRVSHAAHVLGVSGPTVRSWIEQGLLEAVAPAERSRGPLRVTLDSIAEIKEITDELRELGHDRRLVSAVIARLEGQQLARSDRFRESVEQMRRGERGQWPGG